MKWSNIQQLSASVSALLIVVTDAVEQLQYSKIHVLIKLHKLHSCIIVDVDMKITNNKPTPFKVTAIPVQCCLNIDINDTDCSVSL